LAESAEDLTGDKEDLKRICKQAMNKASTKRLISKQESMVLLGDLPLTECTEALISVSVNNSKALRRAEETSTDSSFVTEYAKRPKIYENMSMYSYFINRRNTPEARRKRTNHKFIIPNFCGISGTPVFPVTDNYARHTIIVYKPWRTYPTNLNWKTEFELFINNPHCPESARMSYDRVMQRYYDKMTHYEPKSSSVDHSGNPVTQEDYDLMTLAGLNGTGNEETDKELVHRLERGDSYEWDKPPKVRHIANI